MTTERPTHVVPLTATGRGALATILVDGQQAVAKVSCYFHPAAQKPLRSFAVGQIVYGRWQFGRDHAEDLVVCRAAPNRVEINCHGGIASSARIIASLVEAGCQQLRWQEWLRQSETGSIESASLVALTHTRTERTAAILLDQYRGALRHQIDEVIAHLRQGDSAAAREELQQLVDLARLGLHLTHPWRVVVAGAPNVGKSSLLNALLGYRRAIVYHQPGTTRDVVSAPAAFQGWPIEIADTAGLRSSHDAVESEGIQRACAELMQADLVLLVFDASLPWTVAEDDLAATYPDACVVHNKCDLLDVTPSDRPAGMWTSALEGIGIDQLADRMVQSLVPQVPPAGAAIPFTPAQVEALSRSLDAMTEDDATRSIELLATVTGSNSVL